MADVRTITIVQLGQVWIVNPATNNVFKLHTIEVGAGINYTVISEEYDLYKISIKEAREGWKEVEKDS